MYASCIYVCISTVFKITTYLKLYAAWSVTLSKVTQLNNTSTSDGYFSVDVSTLFSLSVAYACMSVGSSVARVYKIQHP